MSKWYLMTLWGKDKAGIVAHVTSALYEGGCDLGEVSMMRLQGTMVLTLMVQFEGRKSALADAVQTVTDSFGLELQITALEVKPGRGQRPDVTLTLSGANRAGMVAKATMALSQVGLHILRLHSTVRSGTDGDVYLLHIEGEATEGIAALESAVAIISREGVDVSLDAPLANSLTGGGPG